MGLHTPVRLGVERTRGARGGKRWDPFPAKVTSERSGRPTKRDSRPSSASAEAPVPRPLVLRARSAGGAQLHGAPCWMPPRRPLPPLRVELLLQARARTAAACAGRKGRQGASLVGPRGGTPRSVPPCASRGGAVATSTTARGGASRAPTLSGPPCVAYPWVLQTSPALTQIRATPPRPPPAAASLGLFLSLRSRASLGEGKLNRAPRPSCLWPAFLMPVQVGRRGAPRTSWLRSTKRSGRHARHPGEETPPQEAQMTNRFPHFLICYPVAASGRSHVPARPQASLGASHKPGQGQGPSAPREQCPVAALR